MTARIVLVLFVAWLAAPTLAHAEVVSAQARAAVAEDGQARVVVMLRPSLTPAAPDRGRMARAARVRAAGDAVLDSLPSGPQALRRRFALVPALVLAVDARDLRALSDNPAVLAIDVDVGGSGSGVAPDAASTLNRVAQLESNGLGGAGEKVAVIDSGVDSDHADLRDRLIDEACFCSAANGGCCPNETATQFGAGAAEDDNGHGTNVTGIVVGEGDIAPRGAVPDAQLVAVKVLDADNRFCCTSDVIAAMDWVASQHPDVAAVNLSLGTDATFPGHCDASTAWTQALASAVGALVANGAVVTVSTGNQGNVQQIQAPACIRDALSVAATWDANLGAVDFLGCTDPVTAARQPTCFSNRSPTTDLFAAGAFVTSTGFNGGTSTYGGTSQAAPMVAACAVALKQAAPVATVDQRMDAMTLSLTRISDPASGRTYAFLDCLDAVTLLDPDALGPIPLNGAQPLIPPKRNPGSASLPALPGSGVSGEATSQRPGAARPGASDPQSQHRADSVR